MRPCWVCESGNSRPWKTSGIDRPLRADDLRITDGRYGVTVALRRCESCGFVFADNDVEDVPGLYDDLVDPAYIETADARLLQMRWLLDRVLRAAPGSQSLLDVGAGIGLLVGEARRRGLAAVGVEPSRALADHAEALGLPVLVGRLPHPALSRRQFDIVTLIDVIEHVGDPVQLLTDCAAVLATGGMIVVVTPDIGSLLARASGTRWWHLRLAHIGYFTRAALTIAASRAGLEIAHVSSARWFFRVRYLAERATRYVPIGWLNRAGGAVPPLRWLYERTITLDLHDSMAVLLTRAGGGDRRRQKVSTQQTFPAEGRQTGDSRALRRAAILR